MTNQRTPLFLSFLIAGCSFAEIGSFGASTLDNLSERSSITQSGAARQRTQRTGQHGNAGEFMPAEMTKSSGCKAEGTNPDSECTPGAVMGISVDVICTESTRGRRAVTTAMKNQVYAEYGITSHPTGAFEVDHFIPLELGGSNDIANLWPEPADPKPGFHEKDKVETALHNEVCKAKTMT